MSSTGAITCDVESDGKFAFRWSVPPASVATSLNDALSVEAARRGHASGACVLDHVSAHRASNPAASCLVHPSNYGMTLQDLTIVLCPGECLRLHFYTEAAEH
ncbi:hypothetical protein WJX73_000140 [Symbiochloris irregularis]|uniref:Uncharacterized protein n=1 Tax=Symbiochloris irregularis TaxID=706552 RepID=A0AAW1PN67_9CHLO